MLCQIGQSNFLTVQLLTWGRKAAVTGLPLLLPSCESQACFTGLLRFFSFPTSLLPSQPASRVCITHA